MIPVASRDSLLLFCEKVDKLLNSSTRRVLEQGKQPFRFSARVGEPVLIETNGPPDDSIEAFVLTLRFFIQDNESISIRNIATLIDSLPVSDVIKDRVRDGRHKFNRDLDEKCGFQIDAQHLTHREVYNAFIYGHLAHANVDKREIYAAWTQNPVVMGLMSAVFWNVLWGFLVMLSFLKANIEEAVSELEAAKQWP
jgi:hypothetical protein